MCLYLKSREWISIHAPHARSDESGRVKIYCDNISIHAPHARSDAHASIAADKERSYFNPRSSCEERRDVVIITLAHAAISIHAPHARSDEIALSVFALLAYFNPRSSCEERPS